MPIYQVTPIGNNRDALARSVTTTINERDRIPLQNNMGWFIDFDGTTIELSNALGVTGQAKGENSTVGSTLITAVTSYYGRGPTDMWEWLKIRFERN